MKRKSGKRALRAGGRRKKRFVHTFKWQGEIAEMGFQHKAASMGFTVTKPYGDSDSYDFIVDAGNRLWRVEVKSGSSMKRNGYRVAVRHFWRGPQSKRAYTADQIDILAVYVVPLKVWYIIPVGAFTPSESLILFPHLPGHAGKYEQFREAWHLLACRRGGKLKKGIVTEPACGYCPLSGKICPGCVWK
jgi:MoaA/NifB/PqqE/SkfB family radical SAM enzyme